MEEKKADDKRIENKNEMENINNQIDFNKEKLKKLDDLESDFQELKKLIDHTVELLGKSIKGGNIDKVLDSISDDNKKTFINVTKNIDEDRSEIESDLRILNEEKDNLTKENKE